MSDTEQSVPDTPHQLATLALRGDSERKWHGEARGDFSASFAAIRHQEMSEAEAVDRADEQVGRFAQTEVLEATSELACAFLAVRDAGHTRGAPRGTHVFG